MKKIQGILFMLLMMVTAFVINSEKAYAEQRDYPISSGVKQIIETKVGDTGKLMPVLPEGTVVARMEYVSYDETAFLIQPDGTYTALKAENVGVSIQGYDEMGFQVFWAYVQVKIMPDLTNATLSSGSGTAYLLGASDFDYFYSKTPTVSFDLVNCPALDDGSNVNVSYSFSNPDMSASCVREGNHFTLIAGKAGTTLLTLTINDSVFTYTFTVKNAKISLTSYVMAKGKTKKLKVSGYSGKVKWTSSNKKVVTVSSSGKIKGKKLGNAIITAKVGDGYVGCAVSVVSNKTRKIVAYARKNAPKWKYSQAKRMQKGYYDCSSLVWKAYAKYGRKLGSATYAPTSANLCKWCFGKKKRIKGGLSVKNINKMKLRPGDLMFETSNNKSRYKGIYHVEMFAGYRVTGYSENKPMYTYMWANRFDGYYGLFGQPMARP